MSLTAKVKLRGTMGNRRSSITEITFDSSYPTGGESLAAADLGLNGLDLVLPESPSGYLVQYDRTNKKLVVRTTTNAHSHQQSITTGSTTAADATTGALVEDSSGAETDFRAMGTAVDTTYDIGDTEDNTAAAGAEVANDTDLSTLKVMVFAVGR